MSPKTENICLFDRGNATQIHVWFGRTDNQQENGKENWDPRNLEMQKKTGRTLLIEKRTSKEVLWLKIEIMKNTNNGHLKYFGHTRNYNSKWQSFSPEK